MSWLFGSSRSSTSGSKASASQAPAGADDSIEKCPVDHETRNRWLQQNAGANNAKQSHPFVSATSSVTTRPHLTPPAVGPPGTKAALALSSERETSSIPRYSNAAANDQGNLSNTGSNTSTPSNWVYPSPSQFFTALQRKNRNPREQDMDIVVPIHNAVNERTWKQVLDWEQEADPSKTDKVQLVSFKGRPNDRTPRAWWRILLGYQPPFDRHDWIVDRDGQRIRYVIDFYTGRGGGGGAGAGAALPAGIPPQLAFYLDVRPAIDSFESIRMRIKHNFNRLFGLRPAPSSQSQPQFQQEQQQQPNRSVQ